MEVRLIDGVLKGYVPDVGWVDIVLQGVNFDPKEGVKYSIEGMYPISVNNDPLIISVSPAAPYHGIARIKSGDEFSAPLTELVKREQPNHLKVRRMSPLDLSSLSAEEIQIAWQENKKMDMAHSINSYLKDRGINSLTEEQIQDIFTRLPVMSLLNPEGPVTVLPMSTTKGEVVSALRRKADTTTRISVAFDRVCFALEIRQDQTLEEINHEVSKRFPATIAFLKLIMNDISRILEGQEMSIERLESVLEQLKSLVEIVDPRSVNIKE